MTRFNESMAPDDLTVAMTSGSSVGVINVRVRTRTSAQFFTRVRSIRITHSGQRGRYIALVC
jgi:hypothetical protein